MLINKLNISNDLNSFHIIINYSVFFPGLRTSCSSGFRIIQEIALIPELIFLVITWKRKMKYANVSNPT